MQWASNICTSVVFGRAGGVSNVFVLFHYLLRKAKLDLSALGEGFDSWYINVSFSTSSIASCGVMKTPSCIILIREYLHVDTSCQVLRQGSVTGVILVGRSDSLGFHSVTRLVGF